MLLGTAHASAHAHTPVPQAKVQIYSEMQVTSGIKDEVEKSHRALDAIVSFSAQYSDAAYLQCNIMFLFWLIFTCVHDDSGR